MTTEPPAEGTPPQEEDLERIEVEGSLLAQIKVASLQRRLGTEVDRADLLEGALAQKQQEVLSLRQQVTDRDAEITGLRERLEATLDADRPRDADDPVAAPADAT